MNVVSNHSAIECTALYNTYHQPAPITAMFAGSQFESFVVCIVKKYGCSTCFNFVRSSLNKDIDYGTACSECDGLNATRFRCSVDKRSHDRHKSQFPTTNHKDPEKDYLSRNLILTLTLFTQYTAYPRGFRFFRKPQPQNQSSLPMGMALVDASNFSNLPQET